jgi:ubiquitin C-terminal hydrolase
VVSASKAIKIQALPQVLLLHLMRFSYGALGSGKLHKPVRFSLDLTLGRELLASPSSAGSEVDLSYHVPMIIVVFDHIQFVTFCIFVIFLVLSDWSVNADTQVRASCNSDTSWQGSIWGSLYC